MFATEDNAKTLEYGGVISFVEGNIVIGFVFVSEDGLLSGDIIIGMGMYASMSVIRVWSICWPHVTGEFVISHAVRDQCSVLGVISENDCSRICDASGGHEVMQSPWSY